MPEKRSKLLDSKTTILITLFVLSFAIKLIFKVDYLEDYDAIDFAFGLKEFDLSSYKPHFPGYPVYIFVARVFHYFFKDDTLSLISLNIFFGSLCVVYVYLITLKLFDKGTALLSALIFIANPAISILSNSANSDVLGLFFLLLFIYYLVLFENKEEKDLKYIFFSSFFFGLTLGVRVSYAPFFILWLIYSRFFSFFKLKGSRNLRLPNDIFISSGKGFLAGVFIWLLPLLYFVGAQTYYFEGIKFISGHFNDWGGTYVTDPSAFSRLYRFFWQLFIKGLGAYFHDTTLLRLAPTIVFIISIFYFIKKARHNILNGRLKILLLCIVPYVLWVFFAQNLEKVRHVAPLVPILIIFISYAIKKTFLSGELIKKSLGVTIIIISFSFMLADTLILLNQHKNNPPPPYSVMKYLSDNSSSSDSIIYCGETERFFSYYNPDYMVKRFKTAKEVVDDLDGSLVEPENIYITSTVKGVKSLDVKEVASFSRSRYIYNPFNKIILYRLNRESVNLLEIF
jgi:4-amino-4-deoxy-L-arabinose transferase-like glycosyltransferase